MLNAVVMILGTVYLEEIVALLAVLRLERNKSVTTLTASTDLNGQVSTT